MIASAAYILRVPKDRRETLLDSYKEPPFFSPVPTVTEPVPRFDHSTRAPLIVFCSFEDGAITHIAEGWKGASAGTGLVCLNLRSLEPLKRPIPFKRLLKHAPKRFARHLRQRLNSGGKLPPKSAGAFIDTILELEPTLAPRLERFSKRRAERLRRLTSREKANLAEQKETLSTALALAGIGTNDVLAWSPTEREPRSFLEDLPQAYLREDAVLISDYSEMPGFDAVKQYPFAAREFRALDNPDIRLKVIMANRLLLEEQTGADLIYYNETFQSFVLVQYKSMNGGTKGPEFRWRTGDKLAEEIARMDIVLKALELEPHDASATSFRLHANPFFLKLCPRLVFNPDDKGLAQGMYFPLDYWKALATDPATMGPRDGRVITYDNVSRRLSNPDFLALVTHAWVGTTVPQSKLLEHVIESVIQSGKTVTLAVKAAIPPREAEIDVGDEQKGDPVDLDDLLR
ncbi:MAG: hypothetical protein JWN63_232 [Candidatus Acidoferrum typicum]|nr:hypothetical protein [Candidatus Acidoferrum typicum]